MISVPPHLAISQSDAEFYVRAAFRGVLGRDPDPVGLQYFSAMITRTGDPLAPLIDLIGSPEYRERADIDASLLARLSAPAAPDMRLPVRIRRRLGRALGVPGVAEQQQRDHRSALVLAWLAQLSNNAATRQHVQGVQQPPQNVDLQPLHDRLDDERRRVDAQFQRQRMDQTAMAARLLSIEQELAASSARLDALAPLAARLQSVEEELAAQRAEPEQVPPPPPPLTHTQAFEDAHVNLTTGPYGRFLTIVPDLVGGAIERGEFWDPHLKPIIECHANTARSAIDAGAFIGFHTVFLSRHFRQVHAFEPQPRCFRLLNANVELNFCRNVLTYNAPLYDAPVDMALADADHQQVAVPWQDGQVDYATIGNAAALAFVPVVQTAGSTQRSMTIDMLGLDDVGFIKIDTQGCDLRVLIGARTTIMACRPVITLEFEQELAAQHGDTLTDFHRFFAECDYDLVETAHTGARQWDFLATPR